MFMTVIVKAIFSSKNTEERTSDMYIAAQRLTNRKSSIKVTEETNGSDDQEILIATFTMKNISQYKVVTEISDTFEFYNLDSEDLIISFKY